MLLQTNSYVVPKEKRSEHARLLRRFRQTLARLGCDHFEVYEQVGANWSSGEPTGRYVQIMRFRDRRHQQAVQAAERVDPGAQALIAEFCALINFPYQQQQGLFAVGFYTSVLPVAPPKSGTPSVGPQLEPGEGDAATAAAAAATGAVAGAVVEQIEETGEEPQSEAGPAAAGQDDAGTVEGDESFPRLAESSEHEPGQNGEGATDFELPEQTDDAAAQADVSFEAEAEPELDELMPEGDFAGDDAGREGEGEVEAGGTGPARGE